MSRSYKKHPEYAMVVCCNGTKRDRKICNRMVRSKSRQIMRNIPAEDLDRVSFPLPNEVWDKWSWAADGGPYYMESYAVAKKDWKRAVKMEMNDGWFVKSVKRIKYLIRLYKYQYKMK